MRTTIYLLAFFIVFTSCKKAVEPLKNPTFSGNQETATIGDTVTVKGEDFPLEMNKLKILFNGNESQIVSLSATEIRFKVPVVKTKEIEVAIKFNNRLLQSFPIKLSDVRITNISEKVKLGELCRLYGKNFQYLASPALVINNITVEPDSIDENGMSFTLPDILYPDRKVKLVINDRSLDSELGYEAKITDKWVRVAYSPFVKRDLFSAFVFKNEGYVLGNNQEGTKKVNYFYKLNPDTYKYQVDTVPLQTTTAFATPNHVYYVVNGTDIFEYNFGDKSSSYVTTCPDYNKNGFSYFTVGEDIYCLQEYSYRLEVDPLATLFFKFDHQSKTWQSRTAPNNLKKFRTYSATVANDIYFLKDETTLIKYSSLEDKWVQNLERPVVNGTKFHIDAVYSNALSVYALYNIDGLEYMYEYSTYNGKWKNLGAIISSPTYNFFGFFIGKKHFIGGFKHDTLSSDLFESDVDHIFRY